MTSSDGWTRVGDDVVIHDGWLKLVKRRYRMSDGRETDWEVLAGFESVAVLPLTDDGQLVMVRQFRTGPGLSMLNLPGGIVDPGESVAEAAARELTEETGYEPGTLEVVTSLYPMGHSDWVKHLAIARGCTPTGHQELDDDEDCEPVLMTPHAVRRAAKAGELVGTDVVYLGLDHAGLLA